MEPGGVEPHSKVLKTSPQTNETDPIFIFVAHKNPDLPYQKHLGFFICPKCNGAGRQCKANQGIKKT